MRLIDADALINELNNSHYPGAPYIDAGISIAIGKVCDAPTIEPERPKGKWVDSWRSKMDGTRYWYRECDNCGYERNDCDPEKDSNFCPNCGADMREPEDIPMEYFESGGR